MNLEGIRTNVNNMRMNYQKIYEQLGRLFYAIAASDKKISRSEVAKLKELVKRDWLSLEDSIDFYGTDAGNYIYISFDYLESIDMPAEDAFRSFEYYFAEHNKAFSMPLREKILASATEISQTFRASNKLKCAYLKKLNELLGVEMTAAR
jgi:hypothetical protein